MAQQSFSDISSVSFQHDNFDCERALFSGATLNQLPSTSSTQKITHILETNCSNKSELVCEGSFMKGLDRFQKQLSFEDSVYDIYTPVDQYCIKVKASKIKSNKDIQKKYVVSFQKPRSKEKSSSMLKSSILVSSPSLAKYHPSTSSLYSLKADSQYYTARTTTNLLKPPKKSLSKSSKASNMKQSVIKQREMVRSKSKSAKSVRKNGLVQNKSKKPFK